MPVVFSIKERVTKAMHLLRMHDCSLLLKGVSGGNATSLPEVGIILDIGFHLSPF